MLSITVDGIRSVRLRGNPDQPMFCFKGEGDSGTPENPNWDAPHVSNAARFSVLKTYEEYQDLEWNPDLTF